MPDTVYFVIPCYNEEEALPFTSVKIKDKLTALKGAGLVSDDSRVLFVDDGSKDRTWEMIELLNKQDKIFTGIKLSRNRGHQNALLAGLMTAKEYADAVISLDADLQDDIDVIDKFIEEYYEGHDIVYGVRSQRDKDTFFKRFSAESFYKLMHAMGVDIVFNHADYRLMSKRALFCLGQYREVNLFLRGIIPLIGFNSSIVTYERGSRVAGESKYPLGKMLALAFNGITSFSVKPIRIITSVGIVVSLASLIIFIILLISDLIGYSVTGAQKIICSIWFIGGIQLLATGIIGEYIGKIFGEVKNRPKYFIEKHVK